MGAIMADIPVGSKQVFTPVAADAVAVTVTVELPKRVLSRLRKLSPRDSLKAKLTVSATNVAGVASTQTLSVKLKGRRST